MILTRRGRPDVVLLAYAEYLRLRRIQAYQHMLRLATQLCDTGLTASELYAASRSELEARP